MDAVKLAPNKDYVVSRIISTLILDAETWNTLAVSVLDAMSSPSPSAYQEESILQHVLRAQDQSSRLRVADGKSQCFRLHSRSV
jgi:hypothetical protein